MSTQNLSAIAIDVVEQYHQAGRHLVNAYKSGVERAERAFNGRLASVVQTPALPLVDEAVQSSLIEVQRQVASVLAKGLRAGSDRVSELNDRLAERARSDIERLASAVTSAESAFETNGVDTLALYGVPSAQISLAVASAVSEGAKRLGERVGAAAEIVDAEVVTVKPRAKRVGRRA